MIIIGIRMVLCGPTSGCRLQPTCTIYALEQLNSQPIHRALWLIIKRISRCLPFAASRHSS